MTTQTPDRAARIAHKQAQLQRSSEAMHRAVQWARKAGFSHRQAPFAASVAMRMKAQKKREVFYDEVRSEVLRQWPALEKV